MPAGPGLTRRPGLPAIGGLGMKINAARVDEHSVRREIDAFAFEHADLPAHRLADAFAAQARGESDQRWLDLDQIATVEVTSEDPSFPIESVFSPSGGPGWRASQKAEQQIRIIFDKPMSLHRIQLHFHEAESERRQEFTVRWSSAAGGPEKEIARQQWNFSPGGSKPRTG